MGISDLDHIWSVFGDSPNMNPHSKEFYSSTIECYL